MADSVVHQHGLVNKISDHKIPEVSPETYEKAKVIAKRIREAVRAKKRISVRA